MIFWRFLGGVYLKYFFIIFVALEFFYVAIDTLLNTHILTSTSLSQSLTYILLTTLVAVSYILPVSVILAFVISQINLIRSGEFVSFFALGASKNSVVMPAFCISFVLVLLYVGANFTDFAYARSEQKNLRTQTQLEFKDYDIFIQDANRFVFIKSISPALKSAKDVEIFILQNGTLAYKISAPTAVFEHNAWRVQNPQILKLNQSLKLGEKGLKKLDETSLGEALKTGVLPRLTPESLIKLSQTNIAYSAQDAIDALSAAQQSALSTNKISTALYTLVVFPFFAPFLLVVLYFRLPLVGRFSNLAFFTLGMILSGLFVWGVLLLLIRFCENGVFNPQLGIIAPVVLLALYAAWLLWKNSNARAKI